MTEGGPLYMTGHSAHGALVSFYLPWNVMREPAPLVLLESVLWMGVLLIVGLAIAGVYEWRLDEEAVSPAGRTHPA